MSFVRQRRSPRILKPRTAAERRSGWRLWRLPAAIVAAVLLASALLWLWGEDRLGRQLDRLAGEARQTGWQVSTGAGRQGGWPWRAARTFDDAVLSPPAGRAVWTAQHLTVADALLDPPAIRIELGGLQTLGRAGSPLSRRLRLQAGALVLGPPSHPASGPARLALRSGPLRIALPGEPAFTVRRLSGLLRWTTTTGADGVRHDGQAVSLRLDGIAAPGWPDGTGSASLVLALPGPRGAAGLDLRRRIAAWRDGGGRLLLEAATLSLPDCRITLSGEARLDAGFQLYGDFTMRISGADSLIDRLNQAGWLDRAAAQAMRAVIGLISDAGTAPAGAGKVQMAPRPASTGTIELPLMLRGDVLLLGRIPLLRLPWSFPGPPP